MTRELVAAILRETAALLELKGENPFRVRAYDNAARTLEGMVEDPQDLVDSGRLGEVRGIGPGLAAAVAEILQTGKLIGVEGSYGGGYSPRVSGEVRSGRCATRYRSDVRTRKPLASAT